MIALTLIGISMIACSNESQTNHTPNVISVEKKAAQHLLFYSGIIQPIKSVIVTSPADGVVIEMPFQYGDLAKSGQLLFTLSSTKFLADYRSALTQFIKAKNGIC